METFPIKQGYSNFAARHSSWNRYWTQPVCLFSGVSFNILGFFPLFNINFLCEYSTGKNGKMTFLSLAGITEGSRPTKHRRFKQLSRAVTFQKDWIKQEPLRLSALR